MPGSGKSKVGKLVSKKLNLEFFDSDTLIENKTGKTIADIFLNCGENVFRKMESDIIAELYLRENFIAALGGGSVLEKQNWKLIKQSGKTIWLDASIETLLERLQKNQHRPLFPKKNQSEYLYITLELRKPLFELANYQFESTNEQSAKILAEKIISKIK